MRQMAFLLSSPPEREGEAEQILAFVSEMALETPRLCWKALKVGGLCGGTPSR